MKGFTKHLLIAAIVLLPLLAQTQVLRNPGAVAGVDNSFPSGWTDPATVIDGTVLTFNQTVSYDSVTNTWNIESIDGGEINHTADHFTAPVFNISSLGDVTFSACVTALAPITEASFPLAGVMLRETTNANSAFVYAKGLGPSGGQGYDISARLTTAASVIFPFGDSTPIVLPEAFRLEVDGALESWRAYKATDCGSPSWVEYDNGFATWLGTGDTVSAVLAATASDANDLGFSGVFTFTNVVVDTSTSVDHSAGSTVDVQPTSLNVNEDAGTFNFSMDRAGGLSGALAVDWVTADGTCTDGVEYTSASGQLNWADGVGGADTDAITVIDIVGAQGPASCTFTVTATINSGSDTLGNDTLTVSWIDTDQSPPQVGAWSTQGASGCSDGLGSFDAFIPGMRGHGSCNRGGFVVDANVIIVTNRNLSGAGSFQEAVLDTDCPKVVLFAVGGFFDYTALSAPMRIGANNQKCTNWSIVGASAPSNVVIAGRDNSVHGGYGLGAVLQTRGDQWTVDHMTFTGGGSNDSLNLGSGLAATDQNGTAGILLNSNMIWGGDEVLQHYTPWTAGSGANTTQFNTLMWQNYVGEGCCAVAGSVIIQNTARNAGMIRNFLNDGFGRQPRARNDGLLVANNLTINHKADGVRWTPCGGAASPIDSNVRANIINNVWISGLQGDQNFIISHNNDSFSCTTIAMYEDGNLWKKRGGLENCTNNLCVQSGGVTPHLVGSVISAIYPTGYVPEDIANTQAEIEAFALQIKAFSGSRPADRLAYVEARMAEGINSVDGIGTESSYVRTKNPDGPTIVALGGYAVIDEGDTSWDPTDVADNGFANMPTGAAANVISGNGYTALHEWVICAFYDNVMPTGYREDKVSACVAP